MNQNRLDWRSSLKMPKMVQDYGGPHMMLSQLDLEYLPCTPEEPELFLEELPQALSRTKGRGRKSPGRGKRQRGNEQLRAAAPVLEEPFGPPPMPKWLSLSQNAGNRPAHWRWARAVYLSERGQSPHPRFDADPWIARLVRFVNGLQACTNVVERYDFTEKELELSEVFELFTNRNGLMRSQLEAWVLTGISCEDIGCKLGLFPDLVQLYETIYFDVRDRLHSSWIEGSVLKLHPRPEPTLDNILKGYARRGGKLLLQMALKHLVAPARTVSDVIDVREFFQTEKMTEERILFRINLGVWLGQITRENGRKLLSRFHHSEDVLARCKANLDAALRNLPALNVGGDVNEETPPRSDSPTLAQ
jgi:hypothetical protein